MEEFWKASRSFTISEYTYGEEHPLGRICAGSLESVDNLIAIALHLDARERPTSREIMTFASANLLTLKLQEDEVCPIEVPADSRTLKQLCSKQ